MKLSEVIFAGRDRLKAASIQCADPLLHMKQIAEHCLGIETSELYLRWDQPVDESGLSAIWAFVERRETGEPFQYIAGCEWFWDGKFLVGPGVLIPRRETEHVVEALLALETRPKVRLAELGAGSGNIGISVLRERPNWEWFAYEINLQSVPFLEANQKSLLKPESVYQIGVGDFFEKVPKDAPFDWIVSNAPYVTSGELPSLAREVRHEPAVALDGGLDGLDVLRRLVARAPTWLRAGGGILGEMAAEQGAQVKQLLAQAGFGEIQVRKDYSGLDRVFMGRWGKI